MLASTHHPPTTFSLIFDFWAMMTTDMVLLNKDAKELQILGTELDELLVPATALNWEDQLDAWIAMMDLCGKFQGGRANERDRAAAV